MKMKKLGCPGFDPEDAYGPDTEVLTERLLRNALYKDCPPQNSTEKTWREKMLKSDYFQKHLNLLIKLPRALGKSGGSLEPDWIVGDY